MLYHINDNEKILLAGDGVAVINNNSNVTIKSSNIVDDTLSGFYSTVSINNGNTVDLTDNNFNNVLYGGSQLYNIHFDPDKTEHLTFIDYNFPAAKYKVNGWRNVYSILVNDGISASWVPMNKGLLVGDSFVNDISYIPTRLNGFTTTYTVPFNISVENRNLVLSSHYNGIIIVNEFKNRLTADFVYSLILNPSPIISSILRPTYSFSNIHNLQMNIGSYFDKEPAQMEVRNIDYFYANINSAVSTSIQNSNLQYSNLNNTISSNSYNSTFSLNVNNNLYKDYLLSGNTTFQTFDNKNIFTKVKKYEKQLRHAIGDTQDDAYISNTPLGTVAWYPEIWTSYKPQYDKSYFSNGTSRYLIRVIQEGTPFSKDWELCDGTSIDASTLYRKFYGKTKTPNYKVKETYTDGGSSYHFLDEAGSVNVLPYIVTLTPIKISSSPTVDSYRSGHRDGKHLDSLIQWIPHGKNNGYVALHAHAQQCIRTIYYYQFKVTFDLPKLKQFSLLELKNNLEFRLDTWAPTGANWWKVQTGELLSVGNLPTYSVNGVTYLDGFPTSTPNLTGYIKWNDYYGSHTCGPLWLNTVNVPKVALSCDNSDVLNFNCVAGDPRCLMKCIQTASWGQWWRSGGHSDGLVRGEIPGWNGDANYATLVDMTPYYMNHTYSWQLNNNLADLSQPISFNIYFCVGMPSRWGRNPNKSHKHEWRGDNTWQDVSWAGGGWGMSPGDDQYHHHTSFDVDVFKNPRIVYNGILIPIAIPSITNVNSAQNFNHYIIGNLSNKSSNYNTCRFNNVEYSFNCSALGLYRRLDPWIKINNTGITEGSTIPSYTPIDFNYQLAIQVRKANIDNYDDYNFNAIRGNALADCYIPPINTTFKNNIVNFLAQVYEQNLKNPQTINIYYDNRLVAVGNLYNNDSNFYYITMDSENKAALETALSIPLTYTITTSDNTTVTETIDVFHSDTYALKKYHSIDDRLVLLPNFNYTFWSITSGASDPTKWEISLDTSLLKFAANTTMLDNTLLMVKNLKDTVSGSGSSTSSYFNSSKNCIPVLRNQYIGEDEGTGEDAVLKRAYYFLGSEESVLSAYSTINDFGYNIVFRLNDDTRVGALGAKSYIEAKYLSQVNESQVLEDDTIYYIKTTYETFTGVDNVPNPIPEGEELTYWAMIPELNATESTQITQTILDDNDEQEYLNNNSPITARTITRELYIYGSVGAPAFPSNASAYLISQITLANNKPISTYASRLNVGDTYIVQVTGAALTPATWNDDVYRCLSSYVTYLSSQINTITTLEEFNNLKNFEQNYSDTRRQLSGTPLTHDDRILDRI